MSQSGLALLIHDEDVTQELNIGQFFVYKNQTITLWV